MLKVVGGLVLVGSVLLGLALFTGVLDMDVDATVSPEAKQSVKSAVGSGLETAQDTVNDGLDALQNKVNE
jgi:hypothetical protein